jgi:hypothetical protein
MAGPFRLSNHSPRSIRPSKFTAAGLASTIPTNNPSNRLQPHFVRKGDGARIGRMLRDCATMSVSVGVLRYRYRRHLAPDSLAIQSQSSSLKGYAGVRAPSSHVIGNEFTRHQIGRVSERAYISQENIEVIREGSTDYVMPQKVVSGKPCGAGRLGKPYLISLAVSVSVQPRGGLAVDSRARCVSDHPVSLGAHERRSLRISDPALLVRFCMRIGPLQRVTYRQVSRCR